MSRGKAWLSYGVLVLVSVATLYPILWVVGLALGDGMPRGGIAPLPADPSFDPLLGLVKNPAFVTALWNSLIISISASVLGVGLAASAGYALSRFAFFGADATLKGIILSQMFPGVVSSIPIYWLLHQTGLLDSRSGLVLVYATSSVPFCAYALKGWFDTLPQDLLDAARMDGAGHLRIFWQIALPLARPALAITFLFAFMGAWSEFILAQTFLSSPENLTLPVLLRSYVGQYDADWRAFAAGSLIVSAPILALFYALQKHLVGGLTSGAVK
jgi:arabinogalactan oligomer/maltooligosaccharide transport system permease protein